LEVEERQLVETDEERRLTFEPRNEQKRAIEAILAEEVGVVVAPPGFGKTFVAAAAIARRGVSTLVLVHKTTLLDQWVERLGEYFGLDPKEIGILGKGKRRLNGRLDVAKFQSLRRRPELLEKYSQVIVDEVHHIPAVTFESPLKRFRGRYILGLSATPKRKDGLHPIMTMQCGPILFEAERNKERKHRLEVVESDFETMTEDFAEILNELAVCERRNRLIVDTVVKHRSRHILLLSDRIEHLHILYHLFEAEGMHPVLLHGGLGRKMLKEMKGRIPESRLILATASYVGEGMDLGGLDTLVLTMPVSYRGRMVQYLGRVGREGQSCLGIDIVDPKVPMLKAIFRKRLPAYKAMGYEEKRETHDAGLFQ
jgi:superfamily II DNA or RNA helicase